MNFFTCIIELYCSVGIGAVIVYLGIGSTVRRFEAKKLSRRVEWVVEAPKLRDDAKG